MDDVDEDFNLKYPKFLEMTVIKADKYKRGSSAYRRICCVPSFAFGLVMASRMQTHFTHAPWFKLRSLSEMIDVYGTVSEAVERRRRGWSNTKRTQFISEFLVQSVEYFERIANEEAPPLNHSAIVAKMQKLVGRGWDDRSPEATEAREGLKGMEEAFKHKGDLSSWSPELMQEIDEAFVKQYLDKEGDPLPCLFFPNNPQNQNLFSNYYKDVLHALRRHAQTAPPHAREYFQYYCIWQMRGWTFPMLLGTASVVGALIKILKQVQKGFSEVSDRSRPWGSPCTCRYGMGGGRSACKWGDRGLWVCL
jgi:hypothetical protein